MRCDVMKDERDECCSVCGSLEQGREVIERTETRVVKKNKLRCGRCMGWHG
jgi:hypothetical protein